MLQLLSIGKLYSLVLLSELDLVLLAGELLLLPLTVALLFVEGPDIDGFLLDLAEELVDNDRFVVFCLEGGAVDATFKVFTGDRLLINEGLLK